MTTEKKVPARGKSKIPPPYQLTIGETLRLMTRDESSPVFGQVYDVMLKSYEYGFIRGIRAEKARLKKKAKIAQADKQVR